jgi:hypothetical protein
VPAGPGREPPADPRVLHVSDARLRRARRVGGIRHPRAWDERALYPGEYATPTGITDEAGSIVASHSLIPDALYHAFATFGVLMSPDLPLTRRQHEMITTVVSVTNRCFY